MHYWYKICAYRTILFYFYFNNLKKGVLFLIHSWERDQQAKKGYLLSGK